jgi:hypothetical protein
MAENPVKVEVTVTPGRNEKIENTIHFEEILDHLHKEASKLSGAALEENREPLAKSQQLAANLLSALRALRGSQN